MLNGLYENLRAKSPVAPIIISVAIMLFFGFAMTRVTKLLKLPNVTAYVVAGIIIGPYVFDFIPEEVVVGSAFLSDIALAFIAFGVGQFFKLETLKKNGGKVVVITIFEAVIASIAVFLVTYFVLRLNFAFSIVLAALASATAPASTLMTIRQTGAKGHFVDTLLQVVALDDVVSLVAYSIAISFALASTGGNGGFYFGVIVMPILKNALALALGALFGFALKLLISERRSTDNRLIIVIAVLFTFCGICAALDVSPLLGCMAIGTVYANVVKNSDKLFLQVNYFSPPILLLFFVRSGVNFDLGALVGSSSVGSMPLIVVGIIYFLTRIIGKYAGAWLGCKIVGEDKKTRLCLGLALIPQAGVAIGLAALGARILGGDTGVALETVILASSILYELIGPAMAKLALYLSGAYSHDIEKVAEVSTVDENGNKKSEVEILIERINKIRADIKEEENNVDPAEDAFTEAAEEHFNARTRKGRLGR